MSNYKNPAEPGTSFPLCCSSYLIPSTALSVSVNPVAGSRNFDSQSLSFPALFASPKQSTYRVIPPSHSLYFLRVICPSPYFTCHQAPSKLHGRPISIPHPQTSIYLAALALAKVPHYTSSYLSSAYDPIPPSKRDYNMSASPIKFSTCDLRSAAKDYQRDRNHNAKWARGFAPAHGRSCIHNDINCTECPIKPQHRDEDR